MWTVYRKRLLFTQLLIFTACLLLRFYLSTPLHYVVVFFLLMQASGIAGAWYGHRLVRRVQAMEDRLPLEK